MVVINADKLRVTGRKLTQKMYYRHSGYVGNLKTFMMRDMMEEHPDRVVRLAVKGMLPSTKQGAICFAGCACTPATSIPTKPR